MCWRSKNILTQLETYAKFKTFKKIFVSIDYDIKKLDI